jgi:hypothetical protein
LSSVGICLLNPCQASRGHSINLMGAFDID